MYREPSFDAWTIVFLIAAVQGYFVAALLWAWKKGLRPGNRLLALILLIFAATMTEYVLWWSRNLQFFPHMANLTAQMPLLIGPLLFLYLRAIFTKKPFHARDLWHFLPFLVAMLLFTPYYMLDGQAKLDIADGKGKPVMAAAVVHFLIWFRIAHLLGYAVWNFRFIAAQARVGDSEKWARLLNAFFLGFGLAYFSYFILVQFPFFNRAWDYHISLAMTVFIYLIAYSGWTQPAVFEGFTIVEPTAGNGKYKNSGLTVSASLVLAQKLSDLMVAEKLYREPELRLDDLASRLDVGKHLVSQVINEQLGMSFFDYINRLRIEEAQQMLVETSKEEMNVIEVAYAVGFNNKVSFNNTFKKATGMTPTEFRKMSSVSK